MNRFLTAPELTDTYRLLKHVQEQLVAEIAPFEKNEQVKEVEAEPASAQPVSATTSGQ